MRARAPGIERSHAIVAPAMLAEASGLLILHPPSFRGLSNRSPALPPSGRARDAQVAAPGLLEGPDNMAEIEPAFLPNFRL